MAILWPCALDVESYASAGRRVIAPRRRCPGCGSVMIFWSGYRRYVRERRQFRIFIHRAKCRSCGVSHALIPAFLLKRRFDPVEVIGLALMRAVGGEGMRPIAALLGVPHSTARDWRWRYRARAPTLASGFAAAAVEVGGMAPDLSADPEAAALGALAAAWESTRKRSDSDAVSLWKFASLVSGGALLATTTTPPFFEIAGRYLIAPVPQQREEVSGR